MASTRRGGYVALHRLIFENKKLDGAFSRREAWIWLFTHAAWEPTEQKLPRGKMIVGRGQIAVSNRRLADIWEWSEAKVRRFLAFLKRERMITDALPDALKLVKGHVITICNYEKFQTAAKSYEQPVTRYPTRSEQKSFLLPITCGPEEPKNRNIDVEKVKERKASLRTTPKHGQASRLGTIFIRADHADWQTYVDDYRAVHGAEPPSALHGGYWFWPAGEAERPADFARAYRRKTA